MYLLIEQKSSTSVSVQRSFDRSNKESPDFGTGMEPSFLIGQTYHSRSGRSGNFCLCPRIGEMKEKRNIIKEAPRRDEKHGEEKKSSYWR